MEQETKVQKIWQKECVEDIQKFVFRAYYMLTGWKICEFHVKQLPSHVRQISSHVKRISFHMSIIQLFFKTLFCPVFPDRFVSERIGQIEKQQSDR